MFKMKKGFPNYFLGWPVNWEDRGSVESYSKDGKSQILCHTYCQTPLHIGRENGEIFKFCPRCLIKTKE